MKKQFPAFAPLIDVHLEKLISKFCGSKGTFQVMSRGESKEQAKARLNKERIPQLREIARILFRPNWNFRFQHGQVTISQYTEYMENKLFSNASPDARRHMLACVKHVINPAIGSCTLASIPENKENFINKINKLLRQKNYGNSQTMYVKRTYKSLFEQIEQDGYQYLDLLSDSYAVARFMHLRRFNPFKFHRNANPICKQKDKSNLAYFNPENSIGRYILSVKNETTSQQLLKVSSDYGLHINWKEAPP